MDGALRSPRRPAESPSSLCAGGGGGAAPGRRPRDRPPGRPLPLVAPSPLPDEGAPLARAHAGTARPGVEVRSGHGSPRRGRPLAGNEPVAPSLAGRPRCPRPQLVGAVQETVVVVPCFNEAARLEDASFLELATRPGLTLLFVDDGSRDGTGARLARLAAQGNGSIEVLSLPANHGKGEAVRRGMLQALDRGAEVVGYVDADLSTPVAEVARLLDEMEQRGVAVVMGARVALLGTAIQRRALRHYLGRLFATAASIILGLPVYDTQCGAKFFRDTPALRGALTGPFSSRWAFDVELIGRLLRGDGGAAPLGAADFVEIPLRCWTDVPGSKVSSVQMMRAACDLVAVARELRGRARASRAPIP
ncbi:MAG: glycosyltransferase [Deltaproteobacteria bacterium]|nr:MAG: glycosyltransferase [Deltaproteobacteria bacterium]